MIESITYGLMNGVLVAVLAVAIAMHYKVARYLDFFLPGFVALGGYVQYVSIHQYKLPVFVALLASGVFCALASLAIDLAVLTPLHRKSASRAILLLSSLGGYMVIIAILGVIFGGATQVSRLGLENTVALFGIRLPIVRIWLMGYAMILLLAVAITLRATQLGRLLNAAFDSASLLESCGHDRDSLRRLTYGVAGFLAGICGALFAIDTGVEPTGAMVAFILAATAVVVGGIGRLAGATLACLLLSLARALLIWVVPFQWSETLVYALLFGFMCLRPHGLFPLRHPETNL
jgi:branched-subunit amino acid ABC-type transport system permease component